MKNPKGDMSQKTEPHPWTKTIYSQVEWEGLGAVTVMLRAPIHARLSARHFLCVTMKPPNSAGLV